MRFKLSNLNSNLVLTLGYLNPAFNNSVPVFNSYTLVVLLSFKFHLLSLLSYRYCSFVSSYRQKLCPWLFSWDRACLMRTLVWNAGVFWGVRLSSLPTNACSTEDNIPLPSLSQSHCTFQILESWPWPQGNLIITRSAWNTGKAFWPLINIRFRAAKVRFSQILEYSMHYITLATERKEGKR